MYSKLNTKNLLAAVALVTVGLGTQATAATYTSTIGDNDGYGVGVADGADSLGSGIEIFPSDFRSAAEIAATDGSEQTDINSALFSPISEIANFIFGGFGGTVQSAFLTIDIGGLQVLDFGETLASFNGTLQAGLLGLQQGVTQTDVLSFSLDAATILSMNSTGFFDFEMDRDGNSDAIFIDYVSLTAEVATVPVPAAGLLMLTALAGFGFARRRKTA